MLSLNRSILLLGILLGSSASSFAGGTNLLVNGSFEAGFMGWLGTLGVYDQSPNPFSGTRVGVVIDVGHSSVGRTMYQVVPTTPGQAYEIKFALRLPELIEVSPGVFRPVEGDSSGGSTTISLRLNGDSVLSIPVTNRDEWRSYSYTTIATSESLDVNFFNPIDHRAWPFIDGVSMTAVPEPQTVCLLLLGGVVGCAVRAIRWFKQGSSEDLDCTC